MQPLTLQGAAGVLGSAGIPGSSSLWGTAGIPGSAGILGPAVPGISRNGRTSRNPRTSRVPGEQGSLSEQSSASGRDPGLTAVPAEVPPLQSRFQTTLEQGVTGSTWQEAATVAHGAVAMPSWAPGAGAQWCLLEHRSWEWGRAQSSQGPAQLVGLLGSLPDSGQVLAAGTKGTPLAP